MEQAKVISGNTADEIWRKIEADFEANPDFFEYRAVIEQDGVSVMLDIDIDLGGGFEGGYALTRFVSNLKNFDDFRFSLHRQDIIDGIGKLFGMQDVRLGYPELDKNLIVKTNNEKRLVDLMSDELVREVILSLPEFNFHIGHHSSANTQVESAFLELRIDDGVTNPVRLRSLYNVFIKVLKKVDLDNDSLIRYL